MFDAETPERVCELQATGTATDDDQWVAAGWKGSVGQLCQPIVERSFRASP